jgi:predicted nucleotidyltransferase
VAREAAILLYSSQENEYKQAKHSAARSLRTRVLAANKEIAEELDKIADEIEGSARKEMIVQLRKDALTVMVHLGDLSPRLVGSVWRGTAHKNSDIDIEAFSNDPQIVVDRLKKNFSNIRAAGWQAMTKGEKNETAFHVYLHLASGNEAEVIVRNPEKMNQTEKCEIYGDIIKGLNIHQLRRVMIENPIQKFTPFKN